MVVVQRPNKIMGKPILGTDVPADNEVVTYDNVTGFWNAESGGGGGVWTKLAEGTANATKNQVSVTVSSTAVRLRIDIFIFGVSASFQPMLTFNDNTTANARTNTILINGAGTTYTVEDGCVLTRGASTVLDGSASVLVSVEDNASMGKKTWTGISAFGGLETIYSGSEPRTTAITTVELVNLTGGVNTCDSKIVVWELE